MANIQCKQFFFPKLELHAHLNGSLSETTISKLKKLQKGGKNAHCLPNENDLTAFKDLSSCFEVFKIAHDLTTSPESVKLATMCTIQEFADDGVIYLELRSTPRCVEDMSKLQYVEAIIDGIKHCQTDVPDVCTTLILSINRSEGVDQALETIDVAISFHKIHPDVVVGVDLSGDPTKGCFRDFIPVLEKARTCGLKITLHCGEVENEAEIDEMLSFGPDRLGHVTCLTPRQIQRVTQLRIPVELCLTSNVKCGTVRNYESHQVKEFYKNSHPYILGTDDKGVFSTSLSEEYRVAQETFQIDDEMIWEMNWNAVDFIFGSDTIKTHLHKVLLTWKNNKHASGVDRNGMPQNTEEENDLGRSMATGNSTEQLNNLLPDNSTKVNNNQGSSGKCCRFQNGSSSARSCQEPESLVSNESNLSNHNNLTDRDIRENGVNITGNLNILSGVSNNLGGDGHTVDTSPRNIGNPIWNMGTNEEEKDCKTTSGQNALANNITSEAMTTNSGLSNEVMNIVSAPSTSRSHAEGLVNNLWTDEVDKWSSKVYNGENTGLRGYTSTDEDSWSENEAEDCCVYTYKGNLQADLPSSFLTLDRIANRLDNPAEDARAEDHNRRSGSSSPDNEFLEMDFDPGPSLDLDESEEQEMRVSPLPDLPVEPLSLENDLSADNVNIIERADIVANVEPQPVPSGQVEAGSVTPPRRPVLRVLPLPTPPCPAALPNRTWSSRDCGGHHCSSGDLCSPWSVSDGTETADSLTLLNTHNTCGRAEGEGDTRKYNLFSDLYHCIMAKRLVMEKNASFTDVKSDDDTSPEQPDSPPVDRTMIWSEKEACSKQVTQISTSACGATSVINAMMALNYQFSVDKIKKGVGTRLRQESAPLVQYLQSRSCAGATHLDLVRGVHTASDGALYAKFFHMHPERRFSLSKWLSYWISKGAIPIATLNLQAGLPPGAQIPDAWHHQMIFGVSPRGVFLTNPLECVAESALMPQLCSPSVLKVKRSDVLQRWTASTELMPLFRPDDARWKELNVLGQVVNVVRESQCSGPQGRSVTQHITIPAEYKSGITLIMSTDAPACQQLMDEPELPLLLMQYHPVEAMQI